MCNIPLVAVSQEVANITQWKVTLWDLTLPHQQEIVTNVLEECNATFFRVKCCSLTAWPWSWRDSALPKCWQLNSSQHNETSQKTWIFEGCTVCICCCLKPRWEFFLSDWCLQHKFLHAQWFLILHHTTDGFLLLLCMRNSVYFFTSALSTSFYMPIEYWVCTIGNFLPPSLAYQLVSNQLLH